MDPNKMPPTSTSKLRSKRKQKTNENEDWDISSVSESESKGSDEEYLPGVQQHPRGKSLRGILAYQAAARQRGALIHSGKSTLVGVSSRGRASGRGVRVRGGSGSRRGRSHTGGNVPFINRADMLDEHRRIVSEICESDANEMELEGHFEDEPTLTDGNFINVFLLINFIFMLIVMLIF